MTGDSPTTRELLAAAAAQLEQMDKFLGFGSLAERGHAADCRAMAARIRAELGRAALANQLTTAR